MWIWEGIKIPPLIWGLHNVDKLFLKAYVPNFVEITLSKRVLHTLSPLKLSVSVTMPLYRNRKIQEQAGTELGQAQLQLELSFTLIKICCITLMITN